jgi:hypothetical protein
VPVGGKGQGHPAHLPLHTGGRESCLGEGSNRVLTLGTPVQQHQEQHKLPFHGTTQKSALFGDLAKARKSQRSLCVGVDGERGTFVAVAVYTADL